MGWMRMAFMALAIVIGFTILAAFLNLFLKIAVLLFLIAFAYYWFVKAIRLWRRDRHW